MNNERVQFLIDNLQEGLDVEAKNWLGGLANNDEKAKLAKELVALANNGGGYAFIGFDDEKDLAEIAPLAGQIEAFTQDAMASIVQKYAEPPFQCQIGYFRKTGLAISHPVIEVPGGHRTPVFAKAGSPDGQTLKPATIYVRRPGGYSEPARTQDDWEKLIDRLVKARQSEQLDAIRQIMEPNVEKIPPTAKLLDWHRESYEVWKGIIQGLPANSPHRLALGHWTFSFSISDFVPPALAELNEVLEREIPKYSGWPPFTYLHHHPKNPNAHGQTIQAWLADPQEQDASHSDFWRVSRQGFGFLLRPMQEDRPNYGRNGAPASEGRFFDWILPIWRTTELLKYLEALALRFSNENVEFSVMLKYYGMQGRSLYHRDWKYDLDEGAKCAVSTIETQLSAQVHSIRTNIEELIFSLLAPVYEQFEFQNLPKVLVTNVVKEVFGNQNR